MTTRRITFKVFRFDPARDDEPSYQTYALDVPHGMTVLEALLRIQAEQDGSLAFRYACRGAVCGSCAMRINDMITLACHIQVSDLLPGEIKIGPLPRMKVLKDLVVDMEDFLAKYRSIQPFVVHQGTHEKEVLQSPEARRRRRYATRWGWMPWRWVCPSSRACPIVSPRAAPILPWF